MCGAPNPENHEIICTLEHGSMEDHGVPGTAFWWPNEDVTVMLKEREQQKKPGGRSRNKQAMIDAAKNAKPDDRVGAFKIPPPQMPEVVSGTFSPNGPQTSIDAGVSINVRSQAASAYEAIRKRGSAGATGPEIAEEVGLAVQLLSTRLQLLRDKGFTIYLEDDDGKVVTRPGPSGREAMVQVAVDLSLGIATS